MPKFIPGLELNQGFFYDVIAPLMEKHFPHLQYSAGLVGHGSDVIRFDTPTSVDHDWGPRMHFFLSNIDFAPYRRAIDEMLRKELPYEYKSFPTHFEEGDRYRKHVPKLKKSGEVNHLCEFWTPHSFFKHYLGFDISKKPTIRDWLLFPQQGLIEVTSGVLFHDGLNVQKMRNRFAYYPDDIWKYLMQSQWAKIIDEFQMQARAGESGDTLGSRVIAARQIYNIIFMCFLLERRYVPYAKWRTKTWAERLESGKKLHAKLAKILDEPSWKKRQRMLAQAYQELAKMHNELHIMERVPTDIIDYYERGYPVIDAWKIFFGFEKVIRNPKLRNMKYPIGSVDQFIDHVRFNHMDYMYLDLKDVIR